MITLNQVLKSMDWMPTCSPDRQILRVHDRHLPKAINASEARCPNCKGSQGYYIPYGQAWWCIPCIPEKRPDIKYLEEKSSLPIRVFKIQECNQTKELLDSMEEFSRSPKGFVVFSGNNGTGKTYLTEAILHDTKNQSFSVKFITQSELNMIWNDNIKEWGSASHYLKLLMDFDLLAIDDLGTRTPTEAFMDALYLLIESRHRNQKGTIITTNQTSKQIREKFGDAFLSRIASGKNFRFEGIDRRIGGF